MADLADLQARQVRAALQALRRAELKVVRILDEQKGSSFDQVVALGRKQAIEREIDRLEEELRARTQAAAVETARALQPEGAPTPIAGINVAIDVRAVVRAADTAAAEVRGITEAMRAKVNSAVVRGLTGELSQVEIERAIRKGFSAPVSDARVRRIFRTEYGEIFGQQAAARHVALASAGVDLIKVWLHKHGGRREFAGDGRPLFREDHVAIHGQERELTDDFDVGGGATAASPPGSGGQRANAPLDPRLSADQAINCGCRVVERPRAEARQPYIAKTTVRDKLSEAGGEAEGVE